MDVLIKTTLTASNLRFDKDDKRLDISCGSELKIVVTIERAETEGNLICAASGVATLPTDLAEDFTGSDPGRRVIEYLEAVEVLLYNYLSRTIRLLMWRRGMRVDYSLPYYRDTFWSLDGQQWVPIQHRVAGFSGSVSLPWYQGPVPGAVLDDVSTLVERGDDEPLAHQLLREAWTQKSVSPQSSLVFAIAAAEVGFKQCVSALVPGAEWLVENLQTPPLHRMLKEYLPLLPVRAWRKGKTLAPPDELLHEIRTGNDLRNKVSHQGHVKMTAEKLDRILKAVSDLLWILDLYQGREWAIRNVQVQVLNSWESDGTKGGILE
jgi:hypothetical protein